MTKKELFKELKNVPDDAEVLIKYSYLNCSGHGPDEYCYCSYEDVIKGFYPLFEKDMRTNEIIKVILNAD